MIPGVAIVRPRESWQDPKLPVTGPTVAASAIDTAVIHYTASLKIPADLDAFHRSMQRDYVTNRGYSLGYRWSVAQSGVVYQIRGWDLKSAANAKHNDHTEPILVLVDGDAPASPAAVASVQAIIAESQRRSGRTFAITGHGQLSGAATSCPGLGLRAQIAAGVFTPTIATPPPPTPEDDDIMYLIPPPPERKGGRWLFCSNAGYRLANSHDIADGYPQRPFTDEYRVQQYDDALAVASNRQVV